MHPATGQHHNHMAEGVVYEPDPCRKQELNRGKLGGNCIDRGENVVLPVESTGVGGQQTGGMAAMV